MTAAGPAEATAQAFEKQRGRLTSVAYRMLGSQTDAEDAVQEAWLRLARQDPGAIDNLNRWLTTVVGRVCIDMLRSRKTRPEASYDDLLSEWIVTEDVDSTPEDEVVLAESAGLALLVVLDALGPAERLAFVLHDMFAMPFDEIAQILRKSTDATKMLASRARTKVRGAHRPPGDRKAQRVVVDAFLAAARGGDFEALLGVLDPDVVVRTHTARGVIVRRGASEVAAKFKAEIRSKTTARRVLVDGEPGIMAWAENGKPVGVMACIVADGRIVEIVSIVAPERLAALDLPERDGQMLGMSRRRKK